MGIGIGDRGLRIMIVIRVWEWGLGLDIGIWEGFDVWDLDLGWDQRLGIEIGA